MSYRDYISECCGADVAARKCEAGTIPECEKCCKPCKLEPKGNRATYPEEPEPEISEPENEIV